MIFGKQNGFANVDLNNFPGDAGIRIEGVAADDQSGRSVSAAGDVNGDGVDDLIVGAPFADPPQRRQLRRELCLFGRGFREGHPFPLVFDSRMTHHRQRQSRPGVRHRDDHCAKQSLGEGDEM